jgi:hypothetical protein
MSNVKLNVCRRFLSKYSVKLTLDKRSLPTCSLDVYKKNERHKICSSCLHDGVEVWRVTKITI